jgi:hypothetical protein
VPRGYPCRCKSIVWKAAPRVHCTSEQCGNASVSCMQVARLPTTFEDSVSRRTLLRKIYHPLYTSPLWANVVKDTGKVYSEIAIGSTCGARDCPRYSKHQWNRPRRNMPRATMYPSRARCLLVRHDISIALGRACHQSGRSSHRK